MDQKSFTKRRDERFFQATKAALQDIEERLTTILLLRIYTRLATLTRPFLADYYTTRRGINERTRSFAP
jgi:hypothetical protein